MIFIFHVAGIYPQIFYLTGKICKRQSVFLLLMWCVVFFFLIKQLMPSTKATSNICQHYTPFASPKNNFTLPFSNDSPLQV